MSNKWEELRAQEIALPEKIIGKKVVAAYSNGLALTLNFDDDSTLEVHGAVVQLQFGDRAELQFDYEGPELPT